MALVPLDSARRQAMLVIKKMRPPEALALLSYKRDRGLIILFRENDEYEVREYGFHPQEIVVKKERIGRLLKTIIKREFPRSHRVRLLKLASLEELSIRVHTL
jgi:hypothetical protein